MDLNEWRDKVGSAYDIKFGDNKWTKQDRVLSIVSQCASFNERVQYRQGKRIVDKQHEADDILVASIMLDVLMLAHSMNIDLESTVAESLRKVQLCER